MYDMARNRAVIIDDMDYKELEFMLWLYDIRTISKHQLNPKFIIVNFRCRDEKYQKLYEKMDSLGIWKGDLVNPRIDGGRLRYDEINIISEDLSNQYLIIGV